VSVRGAEVLIEAKVIEPGVTVSPATLRVVGRRFSSVRLWRSARAAAGRAAEWPV